MKMNESTMNVLFGIVSDPIKNVYDLSDKKNVDEIQRIVRVFNIAKEQKKISGVISARGLVAFKMLASNN